MCEQTNDKPGELTDDELDAISGGYIVELGGDVYKYAVVDDAMGMVIGETPTLTSAQYMAEISKGTSAQKISLDEYEMIFGHGFRH